MRRQFGKNDFIFIGALLLVCLVVMGAYRLFFHEEGSSVIVTVDGEEYGTYPLSQAQTVSITDSEGNVTNTLKIQDGKADMTEADCPDKLCVHQKAISVEKENIVCLPNRVVVTVTSDDSDGEGLDGLVQ
jgi:hypothetical protein